MMNSNFVTLVFNSLQAFEVSTHKHSKITLWLNLSLSQTVYLIKLSKCHCNCHINSNHKIKSALASDGSSVHWLINRTYGRTDFAHRNIWKHIISRCSAPLWIFVFAQGFWYFHCNFISGAIKKCRCSSNPLRHAFQYLQDSFDFFIYF